MKPVLAVKRVTFYLDDPARSTPYQVEDSAAYDFAGTADDGSARALNISGLRVGVHTISATVERSGQATTVVAARLRVVRVIPPPSPTPTPSPSPSPTPSPTPTPPSVDPSGELTPYGDLPGWRQVFVDDFHQNVPLGSFPAAVSSKWGAYPTPWQDTSKNGWYDSSRVVSVRDGMMDLFLHTETIDGVPKHLVAAPQPKLFGPNAYTGQTYGRYAMRFRADPVPGYKTAWLLWPRSEVWPRDGEIDFPEGDLEVRICGFMHRMQGTSGSDQDAKCTTSTYPTWHTAILEWTPTVCRFILDGVVIMAPTSRIPSTPMNWVLQTETAMGGKMPTNSASGHLKVDWVAAWARTA